MNSQESVKSVKILKHPDHGSLKCFREFTACLPLESYLIIAQSTPHQM